VNRENDTVTTVLGRGGSYSVVCGGNIVLEVQQADAQDGCLVYTSDGQRHRIDFSIEGTRVTLQRPAGNPIFDVCLAEDVLLDDLAEAVASGNAVVAPTPGLVTEVLVSPGEIVKAGQPVIVMEAMKLLQQLCAPVSGVTGTVHYQSGDTVNGGDCLVTIEPADMNNE
jgi:biotin carboxyl carrier protein